MYYKLCNICNKNFDQFILEKRKDSWGKSLGGKNSSGSLKKINIPKETEELAEIVGVILGDGHIMFRKLGKKIGVYQINITGHKTLDKNYHLIYLKNLFEKLFNITPKEVLSSVSQGRHLVIYSKDLVNFFIRMGLKPGNKIKNQSTIPPWIFKRRSYMRTCIRGLIDTDGSISRMSKRDPNLLRISFKNYDEKLLRDTYRVFQRLGFHPSKISNYHQFLISQQEEITKYLKEIGFSNKKHLDRLKQFRKAS